MLELGERTDTSLPGASFDKVECTQWVGEAYLAVTAPTVSSAVGRSEFIRAWKDCLPESWREEAVVSKLPVSRSTLLEFAARACFDCSRMAATKVPILRLYAM